MKDLQSVINKLINKSVVGCDTYTNKNSLWLIFTDKKEWVIELTSTGSLWYNYYFFQKIFKVLSLDVIENQHYITKWVGDTIQNGVRGTAHHIGRKCAPVEDTIQNGVRSTHTRQLHQPLIVEDAIQNGVKFVSSLSHYPSSMIEYTIQNGVKNTLDKQGNYRGVVEDTIQNGVKYIGYIFRKNIRKVEDTIQNGIKNNQII